MLVVIVLGVIPLGVSKIGFGVDWLAHFLEFLILMTWFGGVVSARRHAYIVVALIVLGVSIELVQATNIFRQFDVRDIVANTAGVLAGLLLVHTWLRNWCLRVESAIGSFRD